MQRALALAVRGEGFVEPNPMVGCVIARGRRLVGRGWHRRYGGPHAEVNALRRAGSVAKGATAYVTLEPCSHFGKTPPCADALIRAGVARVVVAMADPNALVAGRGLRRLRNAGVKVEVGLLREEAQRLAAPFVTYHRARRPYVILKWAQSIDGKIATRTGQSKWISSRESLAAAHALRARVDAILVGIGTVLADDPLLTARLVAPRRRAMRIVLDSDLRTPPDAKVVRTARRTPTMIVCADGRSAASARRRGRRLERSGCEIVTVPRTREGLDLRRLLNALRRREVTNVLVEGGGAVLGAFMDAGLADEARIFVAPRLIGGRAAPGPLGGRGPARLADLIGGRLASVCPCGSDVCYTMEFRRIH